MDAGLLQAFFVAAHHSRKNPLNTVSRGAPFAIAGLPRRFTMAGVRVFYATQFVLPLPPGHRFPMAKYQLLRDRLAAELPLIELMQALPATDGELALVHSPAYIKEISEGSIDPKIMREIGFPWSEAMAERARRSVGATIAACRLAL